MNNQGLMRNTMGTLQQEMSPSRQSAQRRQAARRLWTGCLLALLIAATPVAATPAALTAALAAPAAVTAQLIPVEMIQKLVASDRDLDDEFGFSVAISGDTAIVGAHWDSTAGGSDAGSAYVFVRSGATWIQQAQLTASDGAENDWFGTSVAISGDTAIVGAHRANNDRGSVYIFVRSGTTWTQQAKLTASDGAASDAFGYSVAISGDTAIVGADGDDSARGSAYVFVRSGTTWAQQAKLTASDRAASDWFGFSIAISGDTAIVGAYYDDTAAGTNAGSAYVFVRSGVTWTQQQKLTASDAAANDYFGRGVAIAGDTAIVGAYMDDTPAGTNAGSASVFVRSGTTWTQQQQFSASDADVDDQFGYSVAISGDTAIVGAANDDTAAGTSAGSAYVFVRSGASWAQQQKLTAFGAAVYDEFGHSVAISGDTAIVGAPEFEYLPGSAYVWTATAAQMRLWLDLDGNGLPDGIENDYTGPRDVLAYAAGTGRLLTTQAASGSRIVVPANPFDLGFRVPFAAGWSTGAVGTGLQAVDARSANIYDFGIVPWANANTIAGIVYDDSDEDGVFDFANWQSDRYLPEPGVAGVTVKVYAAGSAIPVASAVTDSQGRYRLDLTASGAMAYRLEFTTLPAGYSPSAWGADNPTTVAFAGKNSNVNLGIYRPTDYRGAVRLATVRTDNNANEVLRFDYLAARVGDRAAPNTAVALQADLGNTYGLAWQAASDTLLASAFFGGRSTSYGGGGGGGIYTVDSAYSRTTTGSALFKNLDDYGVATGPDTISNPCVIAGAGNTASNDCFHDVGSRGLGDLDLSPDGATLYLVSPFADQAVRLAIGSPPAAPGSVDTFTVPRPTNCPTAEDFLPFALGVAPDGTVYLGATCIGRSTQAVASLRGYVYEWDPTSAFPAAPVLDFALDYPRVTLMEPHIWRPWAPTSATAPWERSPLLADIGFDGDDLILTIADAYGFTTGGIQIPTTAGDILRACASAGAWALENAGACGVAAAHPYGAANGDGPGNGEYYWDDEGYEEDAVSAGVSTVPNYRHTAFTGVDLKTSRGWHGAGYLDQRTGEIAGVISDLFPSSTTPYKATLLGDLEPLWTAPAIEIGNRVWNDANGDGIQDAGEAGIDGATVELYCGANQIGQAVTANDGQYYFGGANEHNMLPTGTTRTVVVAIGASTDDAAEVVSSGTVNTDATILHLPHNMTPALNLVGLRFNGLSIPQGATITNASIQLTAAASSSAAVNLTIKAQAADNPGTFAATPGDISNRSTTTAGVNWMPGAWTGGSTTNATTPDLTSIVQEIVNRPGWSAGNSMVFVTTDNGTTYPNRRQALSFEHPFVGPAVLTVTYNARYSVPANAACEIRVAAAQAPLSGLNLTTANAPQPANANASATDNHPITDVADSDAILSGSSAVIAFTTGGTGQNNHGLDFGYRAEDWGDLPDTYNTLHSNNGAYHVIDATNPTPRLGACVDGEATGQPNDTALGDDSADSPLDFGDACSDDEDGVTAVGNWTLGTGHLLITVSGAQACLNAWMDFATNAGAVQAGGDGSFGDSAGAISEWILQNEVIAEGLNQPLNFPLPVGLPAGSYYLRYRLTPNLGDTATCADDMSAYAGGSPTWSGAAKGGEVEDHRVDSAPLAVLLAGFEASAQPDHILVAWETVSELNNTGFNLYRSLSPSDQPALLGFTPSAAPGSNSGVAYRFQDFDVQPGLTYWYWLDAVDHSGAATRFDPVSATFQSPTAVALGRLTAGAAAANSTALLGVALAVLLALAAAALLRGRRNAAA